MGVGELLSPSTIHKSDLEKYQYFFEMNAGKKLPLLPPAGKTYTERGLVKEMPFAKTLAEQKTVKFGLRGL